MIEEVIGLVASSAVIIALVYILVSVLWGDEDDS